MTQQPEQGTPIPSMQDLRKLNPQELLDKLAQANHALLEANRTWERRLGEEKLRAKQDLDRLRSANQQHMTDLEKQNMVLLRSLTRLQGDLDKLQEENVTLRVKLSNGNGHKDEPSRPLGVAEPVQLGGTVAIAVPTPQLSGDAIPQQQPKTQ